ncbi:MAG: ABC transporter [Pelagibacterium sp. SCN 63-23]|nr:MAG: ABC transporter [Pelagibacterium sp. SCN 63-23]
MNTAAEQGRNTDEPKAPKAVAPLIEASGVDYNVEVAGKPMRILRGVDLQVNPAEVAAIIGPSGSGKTSLLMLLAGLERVSAGRIVVGGTDITGLDEDKMAVFRRNTLGIVFQSFHLIPSLSALDNVGLALEIARPDLDLASVRKEAAAALDAVGLGGRLDHRPGALSGGEQQRVGLARALVTKPRLLLADEPTGNLDQKTGAVVVELMFDLARRNGTAVVLITHDPALAERADRVFTMTQGELSETQRETR